MSIMDILTSSNEQTNNLALGSALGLWDIARNKIINEISNIILYKQAKDKDLKKILHARTHTVMPEQVERIQKFFKSKGFAFPQEPKLEMKLKDESSFNISSTILDDEEIAFSLRERYRAVLSLETEAMRNATEADARKLIYDIYTEDNRFYSDVIKLQKEKKWTDFPPTLIQ